jgi:ABC-type Na+ efflux pump permease subunit
MNMILSGRQTAEYKHISLERNSSAAREIAGSLLLLAVILVAGYMTGMNIVEEKESKAIRALSVSPLSLKEYLLSHIIICLIMSTALALVSSLILYGTRTEFAKIVISVTASTGVAIIVGYLIGGLSDNLISAIAVLKVLMLALLGIPVGSLFVPQQFQWVFYIFPHYWAFQSYLDIFKAGNHFVSFNISCPAALGTSLVFLLPLVPVMKKRLKLR